MTVICTEWMSSRMLSMQSRRVGWLKDWYVPILYIDLLLKYFHLQCGIRLNRPGGLTEKELYQMLLDLNKYALFSSLLDCFSRLTCLLSCLFAKAEPQDRITLRRKAVEAGKTLTKYIERSLEHAHKEFAVRKARWSSTLNLTLPIRMLPPRQNPYTTSCSRRSHLNIADHMISLLGWLPQDVIPRRSVRTLLGWRLCLPSVILRVCASTFAGLLQ